MVAPTELTGEMFGLGVHRPRLFDTSFLLLTPPRPVRQSDPAAVYGKPDQRRLWTRVDGSELRGASVERAQVAMEIDWMMWDELREAIPPAYTEYIGRQLLLMTTCNVMEGDGTEPPPEPEPDDVKTPPWLGQVTA